MGQFLGLPEVLETEYDEDEIHLGLARPKKVLWFVCNLVVLRNGRSLYRKTLSTISRYYEITDKPQHLFGPNRAKMALILIICLQNLR